MIIEVVFHRLCSQMSKEYPILDIRHGKNSYFIKASRTKSASEPWIKVRWNSRVLFKVEVENDTIFTCRFHVDIDKPNPTCGVYYLDSISSVTIISYDLADPDMEHKFMRDVKKHLIAQGII